MNQHVGTLVAERTSSRGPVAQPLQALLDDRQLQADLAKAEAAAQTALLEERQMRAAEAEAKHQAQLARRRELYREARIRERHLGQCSCTPAGRSLYYR